MTRGHERFGRCPPRDRLVQELREELRANLRLELRLLRDKLDRVVAVHTRTRQKHHPDHRLTHAVAQRLDIELLEEPATRRHDQLVDLRVVQHLVARRDSNADRQRFHLFVELDEVLQLLGCLHKPLCAVSAFVEQRFLVLARHRQGLLQSQFRFLLVARHHTPENALRLRRMEMADQPVKYRYALFLRVQSQHRAADHDLVRQPV